MAEKRRALGRGLGALIPSAPSGGANRPVDVFFTEQKRPEAAVDAGGTTTLTEDAPRPAHAADDEQAQSHEATHTTTDTETARADAASGATEAPLDAAPEVDSGPVLAPVPGAEFAELPVDSIRPNPKQPRTVFDEDQLAELVHSIREIGVLQPVVVRRIAEPELAEAQGRQFELIMGERRLRATREAGLAVIPAIIKDTHDDDLLRDALLENLHRSQLNPLEEAAAYQQLLDDFGCSHEELATRIGRSRPQISNTLRLLKLPPLVQRRVAAGVLSAGHARALLGLSDGAAMERMAQRIVAEGLSVRTVEELVSLGDDTTPARPRRPRAGSRHPQLDDFTSNLSDHLETRVNIALGQRKGKITVEFASIEDLRRIMGLMGIEEQR
ncbi:ParB/RepB/Spo0J family partition protein [Humibacillus xanthopallidus]|uniref:Chromosome segregation DNA-binding protein n=1 Tax=Humibacillus xanthopallidus TaxID=412689 RepID=A0A543H9W2_9MICO|nr:ParB/RepB/Spo0J family partition protein [Humibacillus xanthopallidus]TQM55122.1 chromosome segregation DNA-binding protein [Humibacillus xanthopallidus]